MNPAKVSRNRLSVHTDLPNIGAAGAVDLQRLGYGTPQDLIGADPVAMYFRLCTITGKRQDPCVLDVFISVTRFMAGEQPEVWWHYTEERKRLLSDGERP
ncbi:MAG: putative mitomycin resistance protein [Holophagaceae bacterium]|nr:putative mitomycin resistance protein [Holophagaceae bacterium]